MAAAGEDLGAEIAEAFDLIPAVAQLTPVGEVQSQTCNVRVVSATNRDLRQRVAERQFREDLYFRLNVIPIRLPPLRERKGDLPLLVENIIKRVNTAARREVTPAAPARRTQGRPA